MKSFEEYIKENRAYFHQEEIPEGHEMRFAEKLQKLKENTPTITLGERVRLWQKPLFRVAVVALLFVGSVAVYTVVSRGEQAAQMAQLSPELQEVENYYLVKCEKELTHFRTYNSSNSPVDIAKELEDLEKEYQKLKKEMVKQPGNERVMSALVENLKLRLQLLQQINRLMKKEEPQIINI